MINFDYASPVLSTFQLLQYGYRFTNAGKEIKSFHGILASTTSLLVHVKPSLREVAKQLSVNDKTWIEGELERTEKALKQAENIVKHRAHKSMRRRRLRDLGWVFKNKETAAMLTNEVLQCHQTLTVIYLELKVIEGMRSRQGVTLTSDTEADLSSWLKKRFMENIR
jgi:hypothetical protein